MQEAQPTRLFLIIWPFKKQPPFDETVKVMEDSNMHLGRTQNRQFHLIKSDQHLSFRSLGFGIHQNSMNAMDYPYHLTKDLSPLTLELELGINQVPLGVKVKPIFSIFSLGKRLKFDNF